MRVAVGALALVLWGSLGGVGAQMPSAGQSERTKPPSEPPPITAPGSDVAVFTPGSSVARDYLRGGIVLGRALLRPTLDLGLEGDSNFLTLAETRGATNSIFALAPGLDLEVPALRSGFRLVYSPVFRWLRIPELPSFNVAHRLDFDFRTRLSPALALAVREHWTRATFETLEFDPARELFFNPKPFWRNDLAVRADYELTVRDRLSAQLAVNRVELIGSPQPEDLFFDHTMWGLALSYAHGLSRRHTMQIDLELGRADSRRAENARDPRLNDARLLQVGVGLQSLLTPTLRAQVRVAARRHRFPRAAESFFGPYLAFSLERQFARMTLSLNGVRTTALSAFNPEAGNAFVVTSGLGVALAQRIGPRLVWTLGADVQRLTFPVPVGPDSTFGGTPLETFAGIRRTDHVVGARAEITFRIHELLAVRVGYIFHERSSTIAPFSFERSRFKMGLALGRLIPRASTSQF